VDGTIASVPNDVLVLSVGTKPVLRMTGIES